MSIEIFPVRGMPEVAPGDDLGAVILDALEASDLVLMDRDVVVVTHKSLQGRGTDRARSG
jgi:coenzyme F420-0:L-glutamate ligase/coenzyme F420-1:gamma-L-glutamate ligase